MYGRRRRWARWVVLFVVGVLAFVVAGLVAEAAIGSGRPGPEAMPSASVPVPPWDETASPSASPSPAASKSPPGGTAALSGPVQVLPGAQVVNGVQLGWPHSTAGAVSAAVGLSTQMLSTLDPDRAAAVMRLAADPSFPGGPQQAATGVTGVRTTLGLPAGGPVPAGASLSFEPAEYQVQGVSADRVTVLLLTNLIATTAGQGTETTVEVFPVALHWAADWKVLPAPATDYEGLTAEPGSPEAATLGWQSLIPAGD
jgi:hypothetical protein